MPNPIPMTPKQFKRLQRNVNGDVSEPRDGVTVSVMLTALWEAWEVGARRRRTIEDVEKHKTELLYIARKYCRKGKTK